MVKYASQIELSSMSATEAVIGAADHYARAELVTLALAGDSPVLLDRRSVELIDKGLPSAPYHHEALELAIDTAIDLVNRVRRSVAEHASAAISTCWRPIAPRC